jgi:hypothetical protein
MANLKVIPAQMTCAELAKTTAVAGQSIDVTNYQTASASPGSPQYCAVTGHINTYIGFEILLPISTWRQRYLQVGCGGLCGSISISPPETTAYKPLADGDFVLTAEDDGHSGNATSWYSNAQQRVDFAYLSYHDVANVAKGLAAQFYGAAPRYSYFDGCSQGGHEALGEIQRYPTDFNGVLAGAPASIMTELNSILHEYTYDANYTSSGKTILDQPEADIVLNAAMKTCYPNVGLMLDYRACEEKFNLNSVECSANLKSNCLTAAQVAVVRKVWAGPAATQQFAKYYLLPSVGHCGGNGPDTYNGLGAVVSWTEKHISPNALLATEYAPAADGGPATTAVVRSINVYPYPELPAYKGYGNVDDASSYVGKVSAALQQPTPWLGKFDSQMTWCDSQGLYCTETNRRT